MPKKSSLDQLWGRLASGSYPVFGGHVKLRNGVKQEPSVASAPTAGRTPLHLAKATSAKLKKEVTPLNCTMSYNVQCAQLSNSLMVG